MGKLIYSMPGYSAYAISVILIISLLSLFFGSFSNWLILLFKINTAAYNLTINSLRALSLIDYFILLLCSIAFLGLFQIYKKSHKISSFIAFIQPVLGIFILALTDIAGRSSIMGAVLVMSIIMLLDKKRLKIISTLGIFSAVLLFVGDLGTTGNFHSVFIAGCLVAGYFFLIIWFLAIGKLLLSKTDNYL